MGKLDALRQKIYNVAFSGRKHSAKMPPEETPSPESENPWERSPEEERALYMSQKRHSYVSMAFGMLLGIGVIFGIGYWLLQSGLFFYFLGETEVQLEILAPDSVVAGDRVTYTVVYRNKSRNTVNNAELFFEYPAASEPLEESGVLFDSASPRLRVLLGDIPPNSEGHRDFTFRIFGKEGGQAVTNVTFQYQPEKIESKFTVKQQHAVSILRVPIVLSFMGASKTRSGELYSFTLDYASNAESNFKNIALRIVYPEGFRPDEPDITPVFKGAKEAIWDLGTITPGISGSIRVTGLLTGAVLEPKTFQYGIGAYNKETHEWIPYIERSSLAEIIQQPLSADVTILSSDDTTVAYGENVRALVKYKNNSPVTLKNISIEVALEGPLDFSRMNTAQGVVVSSKNIQWTSATDPTLASLAPGEERMYNFGFSLRQTSKLGSLKNAAVTIRSSISAVKTEGLDFNPEGSNTLIVSVRAAPFLQAKTLYSGTLITNTGPIPPRVGQETTYTIVFEFGSFGADLNDVKIKANLQPYVRWLNVVVPSSEAVNYQLNTNEITWKVGPVSGGFADSPSRKVSLQVAFIPSANQIGLSADLVKNITATGIDQFTKREFEIKARDISTDLPNDFGVTSGVGRIEP